MTIIEVLIPVILNQGPLLIRRPIPSVDRQMVGPFILMDQAGYTQLRMCPATPIPDQVYASLATFTYLLEGAVVHQGSTGHQVTIRAGDAALMTAGRGITQRTRPARAEPVHGHQIYYVQTWIALPDALEETPPAFEVHRQTDIPEVDLGCGRAWVIIGEVWGETGPTTQYSETVFADLDISSGGAIDIVCSCAERALYLLEGDARVDGAHVEPHTLTILGARGAPVLSTEQGCRAIFLGGAPFPNPRILKGSFVSSSMDRIKRWTQDYQAGRFPRINNERA